MTGFEHIAVLDIGKTNAKVVLLHAATGVEIAERRMPNLPQAGPPYPHYDVGALWSFFLDALKSFVDMPGFDAISITTHGASAVLLDAMGELALPVLDYEYQYPEQIRKAYAKIRPVFSETFSPALSGGLNLGAQIHYQKTNFPSDFSRVRAILTYPQYWAFRLTGVSANEVTSLGCHTDLWRPHKGDYSSLVDALGIRYLMAPLRSAFDTLGLVLPDLAREIGLLRPVPVFCGIHDSNASLLAHLVDEDPPFAVVSTGTWVINFAVGGKLHHLDPFRDTLVNVDAYGRAVPSSRFMGGREFEMLTSQLGLLDQEQALSALPRVIEHKLMHLPNLAAGSGPIPDRRSRWVNDSGTSIDEHWAAGCLYLALMTDICLGLIGASGAILVEGPFASNRVYLGVLSTLLNGRVQAVSGSTGTSQGAALLAGVHPAKASAAAVMPTRLDGLAEYRAEWLERALRY